jgi:catechol 2,3-dioxygenase-like lactoylglutathione lyase family enzyme
MKKRPGYRNHHVGDGHTNVAIQAFYNDREGFEPRFGIAHIALNALDPEALRNFYADIFGFRDLLVAHANMKKRPGYRNHHVGDGHTNVAIQAFYNDREGFEPRFGIAHMGFLVQDMEGLSARIKDSATLIKRPGERVQSEVRMRDPQGNGCDLSRRGWEVDIDKWARAEVA